MTGYHDQPVLKRPTWTWEIPNYLFTGGLAGASAGLAYGAELSGRPVLARRAWAAALAGVGVSPALLVSDLGRPLRFLNMLRMFKVTSPMSVGSWILVLSGAATSLATARAFADELPVPPRAARAITLLGGVAAPAAAALGLPLATYTGALLSATSVPVWHEARRGLPFVFAAGAALSAGATAVLVTPAPESEPARRLALAGTVVELAVTQWMERGLGELGEPYRLGRSRRFGRTARASLTVGAGLLATAAGRSRPAAVAGSALLLGGALSTRWSVYEAGFASADDPKYVVRSQRDRVEVGGGHGASRTTTSADPDPALGSPALPSRSPLRDFIYTVDPSRGVES